MASIRRGFPPGVAAAFSVKAAKAGCMASKSGRESRMPAPRRNRRRETARRVATKGPLTGGVCFGFGIIRFLNLFVQEHVALDDFMDQAPHTVTLGAVLRQYLCDDGTVGKPDGCAGGVDGQLPREVARQQFRVGQEELLEFADIMKLSSVRQLAAGVNLQTPA